MSDKCFVDTNILAYAQDRGSRVKHVRAAELIEKLWASGEGAVSTQVLQELCVFLRKKAARPMPIGQVRELIESFKAWNVIENNLPSILEALAIEERYQVSFWDALILQAAERAGASILYSEDLADGQTYGSVRVINPLK
jgi:predicted nucleic acid-binding protein